MLAPTLAPQPPQRMAMAEMACKDSSDVRLRRVVGALPCAWMSLRSWPIDRMAVCKLVPGAWVAMSGNSVKRRMNCRSIRSFQRHTQSPPKPQGPREATA